MIKISWSGLRTHMSCKQKGMLSRTGHRATLADQRNFFPGTVTDRVVRDWLADDPYSNPGMMPSMVESIVQREQDKILKAGKKLRWKDDKDRDSIIRDCQKAVEIIEPSLEKFVLPYDYDVDFGFKAPLKVPSPDGGTVDLMLIGYMDIIVRRPDNQWAVYDVKHTKNNDYWKKTRGQLSFYDLAVDLMFDQETVQVGLLQPLCNPPEKMFVLNQEDRTILLKHVQDMSDDIYHENFEPNGDASECWGCDVKHACSKFTPKNGSKRLDLF